MTRSRCTRREADQGISAALQHLLPRRQALLLVNVDPTMMAAFPSRALKKDDGRATSVLCTLALCCKREFTMAEFRLLTFGRGSPT